MKTKALTSFTPRLILTLGLLLLSVGGLYCWILYCRSDQTEPGTGLSAADKALLDDKLDELQNQLATTKEEKTSLLEQLDGLNGLLSKAYDRLGVLEGRRIDHLYGARAANYTLTDQKQLRDSLSAQLAFMPGKVGQINEANKEVSRQNNDLQPSINQQDIKPKVLGTASAVTGDKFRISLLKSNGKVTAKAKKVNALDLSFIVPAERQLKGTKDVYLSLVHESGRASTRPLSIATITLQSGNLMIPVDAIQTVTFNQTDKQISFRFHPATELKPGIYRASIYTRDAYLGSVAVQLRDSFWFF